MANSITNYLERTTYDVVLEYKTDKTNFPPKLLQEIEESVPVKLLDAALNPDFDDKFQTIKFKYFLEAAKTYEQALYNYKRRSIFPVAPKVRVKYDDDGDMYYEHKLQPKCMDKYSVFTINDPRIEYPEIYNLQYVREEPYEHKALENKIKQIASYIRDERMSEIFRTFYSKTGLGITTDQEERLKTKFILEECYYRKHRLYNSEFYATPTGWRIPPEFSRVKDELSKLKRI